MKTFDATVTFETEELEAELYAATAGVPSGTAMSAVVYATRDNCEVGEVYVGDEELPALEEDDWCVTSCTVEGLCAALRALL